MVLQTAVGRSAEATGSLLQTDALVVLQGTGDFLWLAVVFFVLALGAALVGFRGVAGVSMQIAKILILVFIVLAVIAVLI